MLKKFTGMVFSFSLKTGIYNYCIFRALSFKQKSYMEPWIRKCTEGRMKASRDGNLIKKNFYKLVNPFNFIFSSFSVLLLSYL